MGAIRRYHRVQSIDSSIYGLHIYNINTKRYLVFTVSHMNLKQTLSAGAGTGAILATLVALIMVKIGLEPPSLGGALAIFMGMVLFSAFTVKKISQAMDYCNPSLKQLFPISFLTFFLPILGITFGAPNSDLDTLLTIIAMGTVGGLFWSIPFALWNNYRVRSNNSVIDRQHNITQNITIQDSVVMGNVANIATEEES